MHSAIDTGVARCSSGPPRPNGNSAGFAAGKYAGSQSGCTLLLARIVYIGTVESASHACASAFLQILVSSIEECELTGRIAFVLEIASCDGSSSSPRDATDSWGPKAAELMLSLSTSNISSGIPFSGSCARRVGSYGFVARIHVHQCPG